MVLKRFFASLLACVWCFLCIPSAYAAELGMLTGTLATDGACYQECTMGDAAADAARWACGTEIAVLNGGDLGYSLIYGSVTDEDLENTFPIDRPLCMVSITPAQLTALLEELLGHLVSDGGNSLVEEDSAFIGFPQISGFYMQYDVSAPEGERMEKITLADGTALDLDDDETVLTLVATDALLEGTYSEPLSGGKTTDYTLRSAFSAYLVWTGTLSPTNTERMSVRGLGGRALISYVPIVLLFVAATVIGVTRYSAKRRQDKFFTFEPNPNRIWDFQGLDDR